MIGTHTTSALDRATSHTPVPGAKAESERDPAPPFATTQAWDGATPPAPGHRPKGGVGAIRLRPSRPNPVSSRHARNRRPRSPRPRRRDRHAGLPVHRHRGQHPALGAPSDRDGRRARAPRRDPPRRDRIGRRHRGQDDRRRDDGRLPDGGRCRRREPRRAARADRRGRVGRDRSAPRPDGAPRRRRRAARQRLLRPDDQPHRPAHGGRSRRPGPAVGGRRRALRRTPPGRRRACATSASTDSGTSAAPSASSSSSTPTSSRRSRRSPTFDHGAASLPTPSAAFVGRRAELEAVERRLEDPAIRLLTLTGPGGTGKTSLAIRAAARPVGRGSATASRSSTCRPPATPTACPGARSRGRGGRGHRPARSATRSPNACASARSCSCSTTSSRSRRPPG